MSDGRARDPVVLRKEWLGGGRLCARESGRTKRNLHRCCVIVIKVYTGSQVCCRNILEEIAKK